MGKKSAPAAPATPDYAGLANQQGQANLDAARIGAQLTNTNQVTPYGSQTFTKDPNSDQWTSTIDLSPEQQKLYDMQVQGEQALGQTALGSLGRVQDAFSKPLDMSGVPDRVNSLTAGQYNGSALPNSSYNTSLYTGGTDAPVQSLDFSGLGKVPMAGDFAQQGQEVRDALYRQATSSLDPQFKQGEDDLRTRLINSGVQEGSQAYTNALNDFNRQKTAAYGDARDRAILASGNEQSRLNSDSLSGRAQMLSQILQGGQFSNSANAQSVQQALAALGFNNASSADKASFENASAQQGIDNQNKAEAQKFSDSLAAGNFQNAQRGAALDEASYLRSLPLNEYNALMTGAQVTNPQFRGTGQVQGPQAAPVFAAGQAQAQNAMDLYNAQMANRNSFMGGLGSLVGTLGGAAITKFSDRRLKTNIKQVGKLKNSGLSVYNYDIFGQNQNGVMADEVRDVYPEAVIRHESGYDMVNYGAITEPVEWN